MGKKGKTKTAVVVLATALLVTGLIVAGFLLTSRSGGRTEITLPSAAAQTGTAETAAADQTGAFVQVDKSNVVKTLKTLSSPACYHQTMQIETFWDSESTARTVELWRRDDTVKIVVTTGDGAAKHILLDGQTLWIWYAGDTTAYETTLPDGWSADDLAGIPSCEALKSLESSDILDAGTVSLDEFPGETCVYVQYLAAGGETERCWISLSTGLLIKADAVSGEDLTYRVQQQSMEQLTASDTVFDMAFQLPTG